MIPESRWPGARSSTFPSRRFSPRPTVTSSGGPSKWQDRITNSNSKWFTNCTLHSFVRTLFSLSSYYILLRIYFRRRCVKSIPHNKHRNPSIMNYEFQLRIILLNLYFSSVKSTTFFCAAKNAVFSPFCMVASFIYQYLLSIILYNYELAYLAQINQLFPQSESSSYFCGKFSGKILPPTFSLFSPLSIASVESD